MNLEQLLAATDQLSPKDRDKLKAYLAGQQDSASAAPSRSGSPYWKLSPASSEAILPMTRMREIIAAMTVKSKPSDKCL